MAAVDQNLTISANDYNISNQWSENHVSPSGGVKRKHSEVEEEDSNKWTERQSILNMSMTKLQPSKTKSKVEASLRRSVLIFNTLRHLESQIQQDCPQANIAIPAKDICLEPCHTDEVLQISKEDERLKQEKLEDKQEVKTEEVLSLPLQITSETSDPFHATSSSSHFSSPSNTPVLSSLPLPQPITEQPTDHFRTTSSSTPFSGGSSNPSTAAPVLQYSNTAASQYPQYPAQYQSFDQFSQDTTYLLDSLRGGSGDKMSVPSFQASFCPAPGVDQAPMWEETDNIVWSSKYDEPFANWLLNDDLDHIMQMLVAS